VQLKSILESLLFVADHPVTVESLASALQADVQQVEAALEMLGTECRERGIRLQRKGDRVQLVTAPEAAQAVEAFLGLEVSNRLSAAALETLSIVAYRQPITRAQIEAIRGVDSSSVLRSLVRRGLLREVERAETAGRPILFGTTFEFLRQFGLESERALPDWEELKAEIERRTGRSA